MRSILCALLLSVVVVVNAAERPKHRTATIKAVTEEVIRIPYGRAVKLVFPWPLDEIVDGELPHTIDIPDTSVFKHSYVPGQNFVRIGYAAKGGFAGETTDLYISSHGYHFSFALHSTPNTKLNMKRYYTLVNYQLNKSDRLAYMSREKAKMQKQLRDEYTERFNNLDKQAASLALKKVGRLALGDPSTTRIYEEAAIEDNAGDELEVFVDKMYNYQGILVFPFELKNSTRNSIYLSNGVMYQLKDGQKVPIQAEFEIAKKIASDSKIKGFVVTNDQRFDPDRISVLQIDNSLQKPLELKF